MVNLSIKMSRNDVEERKNEKYCQNGQILTPRIVSQVLHQTNIIQLTPYPQEKSELPSVEIPVPV